MKSNNFNEGSWKCVGLKYNNFTGWLFWFMLAISLVVPFSGFISRVWLALYAGDFSNMHPVIWFITHIFYGVFYGGFFVAIYNLFPLKEDRNWGKKDFNELLLTIFGIQSFIAFLFVVTVLLIGGLKSVSNLFLQAQVISSWLSPFFMIYFLNKEDL